MEQGLLAEGSYWSISRGSQSFSHLVYGLQMPWEQTASTQHGERSLSWCLYAH